MKMEAKATEGNTTTIIITMGMRMDTRIVTMNGLVDTRTIPNMVSTALPVITVSILIVMVTMKEMIRVAD